MHTERIAWRRSRFRGRRIPRAAPPDCCLASPIQPVRKGFYISFCFSVAFDLVIGGLTFALLERLAYLGFALGVLTFRFARGSPPDW